MKKFKKSLMISFSLIVLLIPYKAISFMNLKSNTNDKVLVENSNNSKNNELNNNEDLPIIKLYAKTVILKVNQTLNVYQIPLEILNYKDYTLSFGDGSINKTYQEEGSYSEEIIVKTKDGLTSKAIVDIEVRN